MSQEICHLHSKSEAFTFPPTRPGALSMDPAIGWATALAMFLFLVFGTVSTLQQLIWLLGVVVVRFQPTRLRMLQLTVRTGMMRPAVKKAKRRLRSRWHISTGCAIDVVSSVLYTRLLLSSTSLSYHNFTTLPVDIGCQDCVGLLMTSRHSLSVLSTNLLRTVHCARKKHSCITVNFNAALVYLRTFTVCCF